MFTPKQRMLNAYKGIKNDLTPAAPEFWFYYPAKVLNIGVDEFQREVPHWYGMLESFKKFGCEGWGIAGAKLNNPHVSIKSEYKAIEDGLFRDFQRISCDGKEFERSNIYSPTEPFWAETFPVSSPDDAKTFFDAHINEDVGFDFSEAIDAHEKVGETFLLEFDLGLSFFDYFEQFMGFENAIYYFLDEDEGVLNEMRDRYTSYMKRLVSEATAKTEYESYFIGCSSSCNALLGPTLWRKWDKPYYEEITSFIHSKGRLVHNHNHGKIMDTIPDLVKIGFDCVCPFERPPGDIEGEDGIRKARELLEEKVTFNGNVHTVRALIEGTPEDVRQQVRQIKNAYKGSNRLIVGTGDQVGAETPEENIWAMIDEAHNYLK